MFSHVDKDNLPTMVDVSEKLETERSALAQCFVFLPDSIMEHFHDGDIASKKGPVIQTAIIAGTMAAKETGRLIPFCHHLTLDGVKIAIEKVDPNHLEIRCQVKVTAKTGVEMEALMGANMAALTVYDMCKALSKDIRVIETKLLEKTGGKSDYRGEARK